jgi:hypothetical protein
VPSGWRIEPAPSISPRRDASGDLRVDDLPLQEIHAAAFSSDDAWLAAKDVEGVTVYRSETLTPVGRLTGGQVEGIAFDLHGKGAVHELYVAIQVDVRKSDGKSEERAGQSELHLTVDRDMIVLRGAGELRDDISWRDDLVAPGLRVKADACRNCGPRPVVNWTVSAAGAAPRSVVDEALAAASDRDGNAFLLLDEGHFATHSLCDAEAVRRQELPGMHWPALSNLSARFEAPYAIVFYDRWFMVVDVERHTVRHFAGQGHDAHTTPSGRLAYAANETADLVVYDLVANREISRGRAVGKPLTFNRAGTKLVVATPRGDTHTDLRVLRL